MKILSVGLSWRLCNLSFSELLGFSCGKAEKQHIVAGSGMFSVSGEYNSLQSCSIDTSLRGLGSTDRRDNTVLCAEMRASAWVVLTAEELGCERSSLTKS